MQRRKHSSRRSGTRAMAALVAVIAGTAEMGQVGAQSTDALIEKLEEKGILTSKEAVEVRKEADAGFGKALLNLQDLPEWVTMFKMTGSFAGRVEHFYADNPLYTDRTRFRYRARLGAVVTMKEDFEVGIQMSSGEFDPRYGGGSPVSGQSTLSSGASRKPVFFEMAYGKWTAINNDITTASMTIGKMRNPFQPASSVADEPAMLFDPDIFPEGLAASVAYHIDPKHTLSFDGGYYVLGEVDQTLPVDNILSPGHDPAFYGGQLTWNAKWNKKVSTALGFSAFSLTGRENLRTFTPPAADLLAVPNVNAGNTRSGFGGLAYDMTPLMVSPQIVYTLSSFPLYPGEFPVRLYGDYAQNPSAPRDNVGYRLGIRLGRAGKKGTWDVGYRYQSLDSDVWYEELVDDNNGAFYQQADPLSGFYIPSQGTGGRGYRGGTNVRGHLVRVNYAITDSLMFSFNYYLNSLIHPSPAGSSSAAGHFFTDLEWKF